LINVLIPSYSGVKGLQLAPRHGVGVLRASETRSATVGEATVFSKPDKGLSIRNGESLLVSKGYVKLKTSETF
jgi:hypothetical protein